MFSPMKTEFKSESYLIPQIEAFDDDEIDDSGEQEQTFSSSKSSQ